jgi:hypothetical protein
LWRESTAAASPVGTAPLPVVSSPAAANPPAQRVNVLVIHFNPVLKTRQDRRLHESRHPY